ncbi:hypothetical protein NC653_021928 [Populus alba x Populus x berolinensis]|uniref:Uncharacterized protein n=1 Tax=Populus alba x Populus x berolinensis TaxID=444605 RepID=A0AAD6QF26_9ROSI|nr:hypothetical protein NC653_021928 [Populus alba x Populus x berolinensis]
MVLHDLVLNKYGCTRLPAICLGGYCSGSIGLDVFGLWEISFFFLYSNFVAVVAVLQLEKNFVLAKFVTYCLILFWVEENSSAVGLGLNFNFIMSGYWIFIAFVLFHFIGLVAAVVLGFARVPVLSRLVIYGLAVSFSLLGSCLSNLFYFCTLLLFGLLKNMNSLLKLFSLFGFVVGCMFLVLCIKLDSRFDFIVSLLGLWFLFFLGQHCFFFPSIGVIGLSCVSIA